MIFVDVGRTQSSLEVEVPVDELRRAWGLESASGVVELPASELELLQYARAHLRVTTVEGQPFALLASSRGVVEHDSRNWVRWGFEVTPPRGASARDFMLESDLVAHRVVSHRTYVFVRRDFETGLAGESPTLIDTLHYQHQQTRVQRAAGSFAVAFAAAFRLGAAHIASGGDHLLFLLTLLLPAGLSVVGRRWGERLARRRALGEVLRVITAFTLGHSVTLLLGALGWARLPTVLVESLIAASIAVCAVHALRPIFPRREALVAGAFGLVHGLGFASALEGLGVDGRSLATTLLGFNLGVEVVQAALVVTAFPLLFAVGGTRLGKPLRLGGSVLTLALAVVWLVEQQGTKNV